MKEREGGKEREGDITLRCVDDRFGHDREGIAAKSYAAKEWNQAQTRQPANCQPLASSRSITF